MTLHIVESPHGKGKEPHLEHDFPSKRYTVRSNTSYDQQEGSCGFVWGLIGPIIKKIFHYINIYVHVSPSNLVFKWFKLFLSILVRIGMEEPIIYSKCIENYDLINFSQKP